jgi:hypothetical protein
MRVRQTWLSVLVIVAIMYSCISCGKQADDRDVTEEGEAKALTEADTLYTGLLAAHIQEHFDDYHDVTMRFHHQDPKLNGMIEIKVMWEDRVLTAAEVVGNETGSDDLAEALIEKMRTWEIEGLEGPFELVVPIRVKLVGLDDPEFPNTAILTGEIRDDEGRPIQGVMVLIKPEVAGMVLRARTNREGIFVRTLIPPGIWGIEYSFQGYETAIKKGIKLSAGEHVRESIVLKKK